MGTLRGHDTILFAMMDAGPCSEGRTLKAHLPELIDLLDTHAPDVPCAIPRSPHGPELTPASLSFIQLDAVDLPTTKEPDADALVWLNVGIPAVDGGGRFAGPPLHDTYPRQEVATLVGQGCWAYAMTPTHEGVVWGWWDVPPRCTAPDRGASLPEGWTPSERSLNVRRLHLTMETLAGNLAGGRREPNAYATPPEALRAARSGATGTVAIVSAVDRRPGYVRVSLGTPDRMLMTENTLLNRHNVRLLPLNWAVAGGRLLTTTMEPVLDTSVAGRRLLILLNEDGGALRLSSDFRVRHRRGPIETERVDRDLIVRMEPARLSSLLLAGPEGPLQLLALDANLANRVWPLDDRWRMTPCRTAAWNPEPEEPTRGVVIGPDFVLPQADGGYRLLAGERGLGYRWGPWRGSDPRTWLAPVPWRAPQSLDLPTLEWTSRRGAPEVLPDYPDQDWQSVAVGTSLTTEALDVGYGFVWYRAYFSGTAEAVILRCPDACDLFLNGTHIASLSVPPEAPVTMKRIPFPRRHLRSDNVLAILVEHAGRPLPWDQAAEPHGLGRCELEGGQIKMWRVRQGLSGSVNQQGFPGFADWQLIPDLPGSGMGTSGIVWHRATFPLAIPADVEVAIFLRLEETPRKAYGYLNGRMIGQTCHPHRDPARFWLPDGMLHRDGSNEILIAQWTRGARPGLGRVELEAGPVLHWLREARVH